MYGNVDVLKDILDTEKLYLAGFQEQLAALSVDKHPVSHNVMEGLVRDTEARIAELEELIADAES